MQHTLHDLGSPDFEALRVRAFNLRWATVDEGVIPLTAADPDLPVAPAIIEAIASYIRVPHFSYGPSTGLPTFRNAVARHFSQTKHADVDPARVIATNSAASGITLVAKHVLRAGDEVIVQDPVDFLVAESVRRAGGSIRFWRAEAGRFTLDGLRAAITEKTRALFLCHPHNPLGTLWTPTEVRAIATLASERKIQIVSDEVWSDVVLDGRPMRSFAAHADEACAPWVIYGLSKGFGLAGLRIGAVIAPDAQRAAEFSHAQGFDHTIEGVSTISQIAATAALEQCSEWRASFLTHCAKQRDGAINRLRKLEGITIDRASEATFVVFANITATGIDESELAQRIEHHAKVKVVPGSPRWFGTAAAGHIRLSLATTHEILDEALTRIERAWPLILSTAQTPRC